MPTKTVFGYYNPTAKFRVKLIYTDAKGFNYYDMVAKEDPSICMEVDSVLYRLFRNDQPKGFDGMKSGNMMENLKASCDMVYKQFLSDKTVASVISAPIFHAAGHLKQFSEIEFNNKLIREKELIQKKLKEEESQKEIDKENKLKLEIFDKKNPFLNIYKNHLLSTGVNCMSAGSTIKTLQRLVNINSNISSRANWIVNNIKSIVVNKEKKLFYLDESKTLFLDGITKAQIEFALWLKTK